MLATKTNDRTVNNPFHFWSGNRARHATHSLTVSDNLGPTRQCHRPQFGSLMLSLLVTFPAYGQRDHPIEIRPRTADVVQESGRCFFFIDVVYRDDLLRMPVTITATPRQVGPPTGRGSCRDLKNCSEVRINLRSCNASGLQSYTLQVRVRDRNGRNYAIYRQDVDIRFPSFDLAIQLDRNARTMTSSHLTLPFLVKNIGEARSPPFSVTMSTDSCSAKLDRIGRPLSPGGQIVGTVDCDLQRRRGQFTLDVRIRVRGRDANDSNNTASATFTIPSAEPRPPPRPRPRPRPQPNNGLDWRDWLDHAIAICRKYPLVPVLCLAGLLLALVILLRLLIRWRTRLRWQRESTEQEPPETCQPSSRYCRKIKLEVGGILKEIKEVTITFFEQPDRIVYRTKAVRSVSRRMRRAVWASRLKRSDEKISSIVAPAIRKLAKLIAKRSKNLRHAKYVDILAHLDCGTVKCEFVLYRCRRRRGVGTWEITDKWTAEVKDEKDVQVSTVERPLADRHAVGDRLTQDLLLFAREA